MNIKPISKEELMAVLYNSYINDVRKFVESDCDFCEVERGDKSAKSIYSAYASAIHRLGANVKVSKRKDRVFLIKKED